MEKRGMKFVLETAKNGEPYIKLVFPNGNIFMNSETYSTHRAMMDSIASVQGKRFPAKIIDNTLSK